MQLYGTKMFAAISGLQCARSCDPAIRLRTVALPRTSGESHIEDSALHDQLLQQVAIFGPMLTYCTFDTLTSEQELRRASDLVGAMAPRGHYPLAANLAPNVVHEDSLLTSQRKMRIWLGIQSGF